MKISERLSKSPLFTKEDTDKIFTMAGEDLAEQFSHTPGETLVSPLLILNAVTAVIYGTIRYNADDIATWPDNFIKHCHINMS